ncbi:hypothetical protein NDU88_009694 [Pleurodeles waltl]|uniref:Uncharacterized protein n=1 Tax=Pleurodeles waltl TaxID=8319 RepID=A0AAV7S1R8_PLEWA|nr:hypothetical protein NDU88_009694 [Pleurodeles waltl]
METRQQRRRREDHETRQQKRRWEDHETLHWRRRREDHETRQRRKRWEDHETRQWRMRREHHETRQWRRKREDQRGQSFPETGRETTQGSRPRSRRNVAPPGTCNKLGKGREPQRKAQRWGELYVWSIMFSDLNTY